MWPSPITTKRRGPPENAVKEVHRRGKPRRERVKVEQVSGRINNELFRQRRVETLRPSPRFSPGAA